jgi:hypothetical protein
VPILSEEAAVQIARTYARAEAASDARAFRVHRIDSGRDYYLVVIGGTASAQAEVSLDAETGKVLSSARLTGSGSTIRIDAATAVARAGAEPDAPAMLVWRPCRASMSPFYPIWQVGEGNRAVFVDQAGGVWQDLSPAGPGG